VKAGVGAADVVRMMQERGVLLVPFTPQRVRAVTHLDVDAARVETAVQHLAEVLR
jgi:threonine aldolase